MHGTSQFYVSFVIFTIQFSFVRESYSKNHSWDLSGTNPSKWKTNWKMWNVNQSETNQDLQNTYSDWIDNTPREEHHCEDMAEARVHN